MVSSTLPSVPTDYDWEAFRANAHRTIDFIVDYHKKLQSREIPVMSSCDPGDVRRALPEMAPEQPVPWESTMNVVENVIVPTMTHWQHPDFYAYFPSLGVPSALLGEIMASAMNQPGFSWVASPAATELELHVMEWIHEAFEMPESMSWKSTGGSVIQPSATEGVIVAQVSARTRKLAELPDASIDSFVTYYSDQSHFCVEKASKVLGISHLRKISSIYDESTGNYALNVAELESTIAADKANGLTPFFISANFGATGVCAVDDIPAVAAIAKANKIWLHIDAAYAGVVRVVPEFRDQFQGMDLVDSIIINGSKWFNLNMGASFFFFTQREYVVRALNASGVYLDNKHTGNVMDLKDYQLGLGRPFRSLKIFCAMQSLGLEGFRNVIRRHVILAKHLASLLAPHVEIVREVDFGLVCFRMKDSTDQDNMALLERLHQVENIHLVHTVTAKHGVILRISLSYPQLSENDMNELAAKIVRSLS
ncbi:unnamed protein product [Aphanomyces euteiches]